METSTELPSPGETPVLFVDGPRPVDRAQAEFWPDESVKYEWVMQPASQHRSGRIVSVVLVLVALLIVASFCVVVYELPHSFLSLWARPTPSSR